MDVKRFEEMGLLAANLQRELKRLEDLSFQTNIKDLVFDLLKKRLNGKPVRAFFVQQIFLYIKEAMGNRRFKPSLEAQLGRQLPFVFEVIITIQYLHNQVFDGKAGVTTQGQISKNLIAANLLKELLYEYIDTYFSPKRAHTITKYVRQAFKYVDFGQHLEKQWNTYAQFREVSLSTESEIIPEDIQQFIQLEALEPFLEKLRKEIPLESWDFTETYFKRMYLTCAALFKIATELILELVSYKGPEREKLMNFSICYGMMRQVVNDNADLIPSTYNLSTNSKKPTDAFCDLKNHNLTLPVIFYLTENKHSEIHSFLQSNKQGLSTAQEESFFKELQTSFALFKSTQNNKILAELAISWLNPTYTASAFLTDSCEIVYWNKFLYPCLKNQHYKTYRKTAYYARTKALIQKIRQSNQPQRKASLSVLELVNNILAPLEYPAFYPSN